MPRILLPSLLAAALAFSSAHAAPEEAPTTPGASVFDDIDLLVDIRHELADGYVEEPDTREMTERAVRGMVTALEDPYTTYLTTEELEPFDRYVRGSFTGIGAEIDVHENRPRIVTPLEDSPAWNAGILARDVILEIDGQSTEDMSVPDAVKRLQGEPGTQVRLKVRHESGQEQEITITRAVINVHTVRGFLRDAQGKFDYLLDDERGIGYLRITQFSEATAGEVRKALEELQAQGAKAIILDVRFNPGGLLQSAVEISDMFLPAGETIVSVKGRKVREQTYSSTDKDVFADIPVVVLANEASASAAEIVTGALGDNERALVVGARTFGKGSVQQVKMLEGGNGALKITNAYYYVPSGRLIHRRPKAETWGVDPSEGAYVSMTPDAVRAMLERRRESDVLEKREAASQQAVTPEWIRENLLDPQLAAAVEAARGKLETGDWPTVGESNAAALSKANERATLQMRRDLLMERLREVEEDLEALEGGEATAGGDSTEAEVTAAPTDPAAVQERVEQAETANPPQ